MNSKKLALVALLAVFILTTLAFPGQAQKPPQEKEKVYIPKDVKAVLEQGLATRQGSPAIPVAVVANYYFPYYRVPGLMHNVFELKIKNTDLGYAPAKAPAPAAKEAPKPEPKKETTEAFEAVPASDMQATFDVFLQFRQVENNVPGKVVKEVYVPTDIIIPAADYKPDAEEAYFVGYDLAPGTYLLALAVRSMDQKKLGTTYFEFTTPDWSKLEGKIDMTQVIIDKEIGQMPTQETRTMVHQGYFTYLVLKIMPNLTKAVPQKSNLEILYFVLGAKADDQGKFALETSMEVKQGETLMIKYAPTVYDAPYLSLPLPLKQTIKKTVGTTETTEVKDLVPGKYTLFIKVTDKNLGASVDKSVDFEII